MFRYGKGGSLISPMPWIFITVLGEAGQGKGLAKHVVRRHLGGADGVDAHAGQVLDDDGEIGQFLNQSGEFGRRETLGRPHRR